MLVCEEKIALIRDFVTTIQAEAEELSQRVGQVQSILNIRTVISVRMDTSYL